jgi:arsenite methyltransferase
MTQGEQFFDFAAEVGLTKHLGGLEATETLVELCHTGEGSLVLDVGSGAGQTPVYLATRHGCRVVGVDILPRMVERSRELAKRAGVAATVEFRVADAQDLPFEDAHFDAVITESVSAFAEDKQRAVNEYARVTKPGGYVGLNESSWLKTPPPPEMVAWASQEVGAQVAPLAPEAWQALLENADLRNIVVRVLPVAVKDESRGVIRRHGYFGMARTLFRALRLYVRNPNYRAFVKRVQGQGLVPKDLTDYFGYGIYVGRKPLSAAVITG